MNLAPPFRAFHVAAAFLTVLAPPTSSEAEPARSMGAFPFVGLALGALLTLPFYLGLLSTKPWIQAWLFLVLNVWATRGLHWDGWADLWDGIGSGARGELFWTIVKDSRTGAFGVLAIVLGCLGMLAGYHELFQNRCYGFLIFSTTLGRSVIPMLCWLCNDLAHAENAPSKGLGRAFLLRVTFGQVVMGGGITCCCLLFLPLRGWGYVMVLAALAVFWLYRLARKHGG